MAYLLSGRLIDASFLSMTSIFKFIVILSDSEGSIVHLAYRLLSNRRTDASYLSMTKSFLTFIVILSDSEGYIVHFAYRLIDASYLSMTIIRLYSTTRSPKIASSKKLGISVFWV
jgi:hypothetical protein